MAQKRGPVRSRDVQGLKYLDKLLPLLDELHEETHYPSGGAKPRRTVCSVIVRGRTNCRR